MAPHSGCGGPAFLLSPSFVGTEPALFTHNGFEYEALADMYRAGYALVESA